MSYKEKEVQYLISKYSEEFFDFQIEVIGTEVSIPKEKGRIDILAKDDKGLIVIELKIPKFKMSAFEQVSKYAKLLELRWGKVSRIIGISLVGTEVESSNNFTFIQISEELLSNIQKKYNVDFNDVLTNSESLAQNAFIYILKNASLSELNELFTNLKKLENWENISRTNYQAIFKASPIKLSSKLNYVESQNQGIDIVAKNQTANIGFELKVRTKLSKDQLFKYKSSNPSQTIVLVSNVLRHYYDQLYQTKVLHISWDDIYLIVSKFPSIPSEIKEIINRYRYHFYQKVLDILYAKAIEQLRKQGKTEFEIMYKPVQSTDMEYYFYFIRVNKPFGSLTDIFAFSFGFYADTCDRFAVRVINPEDYYAKNPKMEEYYKHFLSEEKLNLKGMEISKHPFYSIDISHIKKINDINENEIKKISNHILKSTNRYIELLKNIL